MTSFSDTFSNRKRKTCLVPTPGSKNKEPKIYGMNMTVTFDSSAWIEYFSGSKKGKIVKQILEGKEHIFTPSICLMEIKNKYLQEGQKFQDRIDFICKNSSIIDINQEVALIAAGIKKTYKLYTVDALVYTIAKQQQSTLLTGDAHFKDLENVKLL
jgi:predicted nucleic acid-binding protein